ncbi:aspartate/glutamate racemase family protein [Azospirillum sp. CT11-132]|uniref:aspartate/glutamate racemase family protein n=1 Tax=unclassified Azospirillum TaxID=2630922 RepID=UPI00145A0B92|nr:aspartate/glutamate racemase family protein [Azospirillum sp. TSA2s]
MNAETTADKTATLQGPRIALIHALEESVVPARAAFRAHWPEARIFDLLDTSLAVDLAEAGRLDEAMMGRFRTLADYAAGTVGAGGRTAGILFTCSAFAPAIDAVKPRLPIPVLRPNESAFEAAMAIGSRIGIVVSFGPSADSLRTELLAMAAAAGRRIEVTVAIADGALAALKSGDGDGHDDRVARTAGQLAGCDVVILGQFSMARAQARLQPLLSVPVLTTPAAAVEALRRLTVPPFPHT